jgi:hypothetical protein
MKEFLGSFALLFCFAAIVIGPFLLPKVPNEKSETPVQKPGRPAKSRRLKG